MVFEPSGILTQAKALGDEALVSGAIGQVAGANFFTCGCMELYPLFVDLNARDFGFLAGYGAIVNGQVVKVSVGILAEPVILVTRGGAELQAFLRIVSLAQAMVHIAEVALEATSRADVLGQAISVNQMFQLRETIFLSEK